VNESTVVLFCCKLKFYTIPISTLLITLGNSIDKRRAVMNFSVIKRGYDPDEVDIYIQSLEDVIKSYKEKDNAIKNAIISAQIAADNMIKNAKLQADEYKKQIVRELDNVRVEVERERIKVREFEELYAALIRRYLLQLEEQDTSKLLKCLDEIDNLLDHLEKSDLSTNIPNVPDDTSTAAIEFRMPPNPMVRQPAVTHEDYED